LAATAVALHGAVNLPGPLAPLAPLLAGVVAGAIWGGLAGFLKVARGVNEVISTLLLNFVAIQLVSWSVHAPELLRQPQTSATTLPTSPEVPDVTRLPLLTADAASPLHIGIIIALVVTVVATILLNRTAFGLQLRAVGFSELASRRAGLPVGGLIIAALAVAGALGGLAGGILIQGELYRLKDNFSPGYGFDGLVVALLVRGSPLAAVVAALFFGFLRSGGIEMEVSAKVPSSIVLLIQGLIVISVAGTARLTRRGATP
jgi:simple sugar transport system permease protein